MNRVLFGSLGVLTAALLGAVGCQDQPKGNEPPKEEQKKEVPKVKADADKDKPSEELVEMVKRYEGRQRRQHGANLNITAAVKADKDGKPELQVNWEIDYDGPRPPLTILRPDLQSPTNQATKLYVYCETADGKPGEFYFASQSAEGMSWIHEQHFVTAKKDASKVAGSITVRPDRTKVWTWTRPNREQDFPTDIKIENCYFQLYHWANERGDKLDAWTGELWSNIVRISK